MGKMDVNKYKLTDWKILIKHIFPCIFISFFSFIVIYWFAINIDINHSPTIHLLFWLVCFPVFVSIGLLGIARSIDVLQGNIDFEIPCDMSDNIG